MKNTLISDTEAFELAHGRVPGRPDLDQLADLLTEYRSAAIGSAPRPSVELAARLDLSATPIVMQRDAAADGDATGVGVRRTVSGLFGLGVTVTIILGAASGAAAVVGAGSAGLLPPGAQDAFNQVVSLVAPPGVVGPETTDQGEAPGDRTRTGNSPQDKANPGIGNSDGAKDAKDTKDAAKDAAKDVKDAAKDAAKDTATDVKDAAKDTATDVKDAAKDTATEVKDAAEDTATEVKDAAKDLKDAAKAKP